MANTPAGKLNGKAEAAPVKRGWPGLYCPLCGVDGGVSVSLGDTSAFYCAECEADFTAEDVRARMQPWGAILAWVETAPIVEG